MKARKRIEDALPLAIDGRMDKAQAAVVTADLFVADPRLEADIELGAALNSDKAERVLAEALAANYPPDNYRAKRARAILAALREGLRE